MSGCDRKNNPLFGLVDTNVTSISMLIPQIDTAGSDDNRIFVSVIDQGGVPISDFKIGNFNIFEGGAPGIPFGVGPVTEPLYLALAIDRSGSMAGAPTTAANNAAVDLINALGTTDRAAIIEFNSDVQVVQSFTTNKTTLINVINAGVPTGATSLYDAVVRCANVLQGVPGRRLLLVLTDGDDTASSNSIQSAINNVNRLGLSAYMVGLGGGVSTSTLETLSESTGATFFESLTGADLSTIFLSILDRFNNLYFIRYHRRSNGTIQVVLTYGDLNATAQKRFD